MKSLARVAWAGLVALNAFVSAGVAVAADAGPSPDPVAFFSVGGQEGGSPSGVLSLSKAAMTPSGNPLLSVVPKKFKWTRKAGGVTRYKLKLALLNKNTGKYAILCTSWIFQPASGNPAWKPPVHAIITGGQYRWTITDYAGSTRGMTSVAFFGLQTQKKAYMVIDLSGGANAGSYPVTYLTSVPAGGWSDTYKTTKLVMRRIPSGTFTMGSPANELGRDSDETQHTVTLTKGFYIGVFEVTQRQWELVMGNRPSYFNNSTYYAARPVELVSYYDIRENPTNVDDPAVDWPANSAVNATSFMGKLRTKTGLATFDLPTESQWEYACRAGTTTALNSGKNLTGTESCPNMAEVGRYWYNGGSGYNQNGDTSGGTAKAGSYLPNAWGLYDMHGNVWEWCLDWNGGYPGTVSDPKGAASGSDRVGRGGSWGYYARDCRSANRDGGWPGYRSRDVGFRAVRTLP